MPHSLAATVAGLSLLTLSANAQVPFSGPRTAVANTSCVQSLVMADVDGDGDPDIIAGGRFGTEVSWSENFGDRTFSPLRTLSGSLDEHVVRAADLDGDGRLDIVAAARSNGRVVWYRNLGGGAFDPAADVSSAVPEASWVEVADVDGDGDQDVLATARSSDSVLWVENVGGGAFGATRTIDGALPRAYSVAAGDIDGDGDPDVVASSDGTRAIVWYMNLGGGLFGPPQRADTVAVDLPEVGLADFNNDGNLDLIYSELGCGVYGAAGTGTGTFGIGSSLTPPWFCPSATQFSLADLDLDGDADLLFGILENTVQWAEGLGGGSFDQFTLDVHLMPTSCPILNFKLRQALDVADVDLDGDLDLVTYGLSELMWYENTTLNFVDCNGNGVHDPVEIAAGAATDLDRNGVLDDCEAIGQRYCAPAVPNTTGAPGELLVLGSLDVVQNDALLGARSLPAQSAGLFLTSLTPGFVFPVSNSVGALCVAGAIGRFVGPGQIQVTDAAGTATLKIDLQLLPTPTGPVAVTPGSTWHFTFWHRDTNGSNFTDAVAATFL
ncbi:MAG: VCBS repeat-containing protein [Planctomycetota bacterium]